MPEFLARDGEHQQWKRAVLVGNIELEEIDTSPANLPRPERRPIESTTQGRAVPIALLGDESVHVLSEAVHVLVHDPDADAVKLDHERLDVYQLVRSGSGSRERVRVRVRVRVRGRREPNLAQPTLGHTFR
jgi:hypothetical protein